jgi:hypothetical protein
MLANISCRSRAVSNLLFFRRSLATRHAAIETMRRARAMPPGPERRATRRFARALSDLAKTEAWLEGQMSDGRPPPTHPRMPTAPSGREVRTGTPDAGARVAWREPRSLFGET